LKNNPYFSLVYTASKNTNRQQQQNLFPLKIPKSTEYTSNRNRMSDSFRSTSSNENSDTSNISNNDTNIQRGSFIVVEGVDRCGKTTQCAKLVESLGAELGQNKVRAYRFPNRTTTIGKMINDYLANAKEIDDHTIHLLFSANRWEASSEILSLLNDGVTIICDRYAYSGVCFTAGKHIEGLDLKWCMNPDRGLPKPDGVIFLDMPIEETKQRGEFGQERYEKEELQIRVKNKFYELMELEKGETEAQAERKKESKQWTIVDARGTIEEVHERMLQTAHTIMKEAEGEPVGKLWTSSFLK